MEYYCNNWMCEEFHKPVEFTSVKIKLIEDEIHYFDKYDKRIACEKCETPMIEVPTEFKGFGVWAGGFDSRTPEEKREILKKRESIHQRRDKLFHDYKGFKDNGGKD